MRTPFKMSAKACAMTAVTVLGAVSPLAAQGPEVTFGGQIRPRLETRSEGEDTRQAFTSMRVRAQLHARLDARASVFIQMQDVRVFGEETSTLGDYRADGLDLHQGYLELKMGSAVRGSLRVGRQSLALGEQRLVGSVEWAQQGRSFDGARFSASPSGSLTVDLFAMQLQEESTAAHDFDGDLLGAYSTLKLGAGGALDLYALFTDNSREDPSKEHTLGALWKGTLGPAGLRLEGTLQGGERDGEDVTAYMLGASARFAVHERASLTLWYDHLSGDPDPNDQEVEVFNTLFATNHAFYGSADYFLDIPAHTGELGLRDAAVKLVLGPWEGTRIGVDLHAFSSAEAGNLSTRNLARELDLTLNRGLSAGVTAVAGFSLVQAQDGIRELGRLEDDATWGFLMLNAVF